MRVLLVLLLLFGFSAAAAFSDAERAAVQSAIEQQLQAFLATTGPPPIPSPRPPSSRFPTEEIFMQMVRQGYPPVYRPRAYKFGELEETATGSGRRSTSWTLTECSGRRSTRSGSSRTEAGRSPAAISSRSRASRLAQARGWEDHAARGAVGVLDGEAALDLLRERLHDPKPGAGRASSEKSAGRPLPSSAIVRTWSVPSGFRSMRIVPVRPAKPCSSALEISSVTMSATGTACRAELPLRRPRRGRRCCSRRRPAERRGRDPRRTARSGAAPPPDRAAGAGSWR